jgi:hypothetical protein
MCHTRPKTTQERRYTCVRGQFINCEDYIVRIRRNWKNIPNAWDDKIISSLSHKSWKRHRRTQYRLR